MKVKELLELLKDEDPERIVVMAKDGEGNGYSPLSGVWSGAYQAETTWYGRAGAEQLTPELREQGYGEEDVCDGDPAIILTPVN
jgi:hypothetical protein